MHEWKPPCFSRPTALGPGCLGSGWSNVLYSIASVNRSTSFDLFFPFLSDSRNEDEEVREVSAVWSVWASDWPQSQWWLSGAWSHSLTWWCPTRWPAPPPARPSSPPCCISTSPAREGGQMQSEEDKRKNIKRRKKCPDTNVHRKRSLCKLALQMQTLSVLWISGCFCLFVFFLKSSARPHNAAAHPVICFARYQRTPPHRSKRKKRAERTFKSIKCDWMSG